MKRIHTPKTDYTPDAEGVEERVNKALSELGPAKFEEYDDTFGDRAILAVIGEIDLTWPGGRTIPVEKGVVAQLDSGVFGLKVQFGLVDALDVALDGLASNWDDGVSKNAEWMSEFKARLNATEEAIKRIRQKLDEIA